MEARARTTHKIEPSKDNPATGPILKFDLIQHDFIEIRRTKRENWAFDIDSPSDFRAITSLTRAQLAKLIADGADWLSYLGD
jgi:hypothetical protein